MEAQPHWANASAIIISFSFIYPAFECHNATFQGAERCEATLGKVVGAFPHSSSLWPPDSSPK